MSVKHPIISVSGSSGAGTTSVKHTFDVIFKREGINATSIEGDAFHRYDRVDMKAVMHAWCGSVKIYPGSLLVFPADRVAFN